MANNITLTIVKPGAYRKGHTGPILNMINEAGFRIIGMKLTKLSTRQAEEFYAIHRSKPFYESLVEFMSSGPIVAAILQKENAVEDYRKLIGATNPENAEEGTIRKKYAQTCDKSGMFHQQDCVGNPAFSSSDIGHTCRRTPG